MIEDRHVTLCGLIADLDAILVGLDILKRCERADVERERRELGELCAGLADTEALDGLTDAMDKLEAVREILDNL